MLLREEFHSKTEIQKKVGKEARNINEGSRSARMAKQNWKESAKGRRKRGDFFSSI